MPETTEYLSDTNPEISEFSVEGGWEKERTAATAYVRGRFGRRTALGAQPYATGSVPEALNRYLLIPNRFIFESSVWVGMPSFVAAPVGPETRPLLSASAASIISFSLLCRTPLSANAGLAAVWEDGRLSQVSSTAQISPSLKITARSITFCNSRTFPGQP